MQSLGSIITATPPPPSRRWERRHYRRHSVFVADPLGHGSPIDRNRRARLLMLAEGLERRTKAPGRRNGVLGWIGLSVLRALLLRFANSRTGFCCPSYTALQAVTGLSRQAIADALARLEASGMVRIVRRIVRDRVTRISPHTGQPEEITTTVQTSNLYAFAEPGPHAEALPLPAPNARPFPGRRQLAMLLSLIGSEPSPRDRRKPASGLPLEDSRARTGGQAQGLSGNRGRR